MFRRFHLVNKSSKTFNLFHKWESKMATSSFPINKVRHQVSLPNVLARIRPVLMALVLVCSLVGIAQTSVAAAGTTYYVDKTNGLCSDGGLGTPAQPYCTIGKGAAMAGPGDTVRVVAGSYAETVQPTTSGTSGLPITFSAAPGVIVTGDGTGTGSAFRFSGLSYITVDGFTVNNTAETGIYVNGSYITITNNQLYHTYSYGVYLLSSNHITVSNNHVTYAGANTDNTHHAQGILLTSTTDSLITGNTTDHNSCIGIRLNKSNNNTISNNLSFANSSAIAYPVVLVSDAAGIELTSSSNNTVSGNITYANEDTGINSYSSPTIVSTNNTIVGNLSYDNGDHGIDNNDATNQKIIGNTVQGNFTSGINLEAGSTGATVANNIVSDNGQNPSGGRKSYNIYVDETSVTGTNVDFDLYWMTSPYTHQVNWNGTGYDSLSVFHTATGQEAHWLMASPLFVDPAAPATETPSVESGDYHLSFGSPAIDSANSDAPSEPSADIEGHGRVDDPSTLNTGAGTWPYYDRGAYEFQPPAAPYVTTQSVIDITQTSGTGRGTILALGATNPTEHGVVWSTSANPTTADSKTTDGPVSATGSFTSSITGLAPSTAYHVRAYATNAAGTSYGGDVSFTTLAANTVTFTSSGSWIAPAGVTSITVEVWGGGGKGGTRTSNGGGGGGGGGGYSKKANIGVTAGNSYTVVVGAGSTSGTSPGGDSYFINTSTVLARGGGSVSDNNANGASGARQALVTPRYTQAATGQPRPAPMGAEAAHRPERVPMEMPAAAQPVEVHQLAAVPEVTAGQAPKAMAQAAQRRVGVAVVHTEQFPPHETGVTAPLGRFKSPTISITSRPPRA